MLDPENYQPISRLPLTARPRELVLSADKTLAYVSIYDKGVFAPYGLALV